MATSTPSWSSSWWSWRSKPATDSPSWSGNDPCWPRLVRTTRRWSMKSKSIWKLTWPWCSRRVVRPRTSRYRGTFHQWLRGAVAASLTLPTIWAHRCRVVLVGSQASSGSSGRSGRAVAARRGHGWRTSSLCRSGPGFFALESSSAPRGRSRPAAIAGRWRSGEAPVACAQDSSRRVADGMVRAVDEAWPARVAVGGGVAAAGSEPPVLPHRAGCSRAQGTPRSSFSLRHSSQTIDRPGRARSA